MNILIGKYNMVVIAQASEPRTHVATCVLERTSQATKGLIPRALARFLSVRLCARCGSRALPRGLIPFIFLAIMMAGFFIAPNVKAANVGDVVTFNVDPHYDASGNSQVKSTLVKTTFGLYFYVQTDWWNLQSPAQKADVLANFENLSSEFSNHIYPKLTSVYGFEWNPGIDRDSKITLFFGQTKNNLGGYFRSTDEYSKLQAPSSNEREMLYMPLAQIESNQLKGFLAHEFVHLIEFNQKTRLQGAQEEVWLSEARSDYASTILGYEDIYEGSNIQRRVQDFLSQPNDPLTEWQDTKYDYAVEDLFIHYLVDHYGLRILTDSLSSQLVGIPSINETLQKNGFTVDFSQIFTDWTVAIVANNCLAGQTYCYLDKNLSSLKINPTLIFLPLIGNSSLTMQNSTKNWSGNWQKIIGGNGDLVLDFSSYSGLNFAVPYLIYDKNNNYTVNFVKLDGNQKGKITIKDFGSKYNSLIVIPTLQSKLSGFEGTELSYPYTFTISIAGGALQEDPVLIQSLQNQITALKQKIAEILAKTGGAVNTCATLNNNLYVGVANNADVSCLQTFLKSQGSDIYPEGMVTGIFGSFTKLAVMRFQKKYQIPQTGFVGILTRQKINQLVNAR